MWFNVKQARKYLLEEGRVFTLRPKRRKREECREVLMYNGFGKKGDLYVSFVKEIEGDGELREFVDDSGFDSVEEWRAAAKESQYLYYVMLLDDPFRVTKAWRNHLESVS